VELGALQGSKVSNAAIIPVQVANVPKRNVTKNAFMGFARSARSAALRRREGVLLCPSDLYCDTLETLQTAQ